MIKKTSMTSVALAKVRELKSKLVDATNSNEGLRKELLFSKQRSDEYLHALKITNDERVMLQGQLQKYEGWIYNTDHLTAQISRLEAKLKFRTEVLQLWIDNPVNTELDAEVTDLRRHFQVLSAQAQELLRGREILTAELIQVKSVGQAQVDKLQAQVKELIGQRDQLLNVRNVKLEGARQRITELEAALNYFNGLCQQGAPDLAANWRAKVARLQAELANLELKLKARDHQIVLLNSGLEREIRKTFKLSEELHESTLSKVWNWLTFKS